MATEARLDVLVDNAGAIFPTRRESPDGIEATLALLVVGPFALESGLLPLLRAHPGLARDRRDLGRDVHPAAAARRPRALAGGAYDGPRAYARAKRAQVALMREWARRQPRRVAFAAMHPGWADTPGLAESLPGFHRVMRPLLRTPAEGADTIVWLATHPDPRRDRRAPLPRPPVATVRPGAVDATRRAARRRLWIEVARLAGVTLTRPVTPGDARGRGA